MYPYETLWVWHYFQDNDLKRVLRMKGFLFFFKRSWDTSSRILAAGVGGHGSTTTEAFLTLRATAGRPRNREYMIRPNVTAVRKFFGEWQKPLRNLEMFPAPHRKKAICAFQHQGPVKIIIGCHQINGYRWRTWATWKEVLTNLLITVDIVVLEWRIIIHFSKTLPFNEEDSQKIIPIKAVPWQPL